MTDVRRIEDVTFAAVYPLYVAKVERKGRTREELDEVLHWLTGLGTADLDRHIADGSTLGAMVDHADFTPDASLITGRICGVRVEEIEDPTVQRIRYMDKVVDELAQGKAMQKILRSAS
jgi:hypothetical protein